jgi:hypothetical protein
MDLNNYAKGNENLKIKVENISVDERTSLSRVQESLTRRDGTESFLRRPVFYGAIKSLLPKGVFSSFRTLLIS